MVILSKPGCQNLHLEIQPTHTPCVERDATIIQNRTFTFRQFISQKLVNLHIIWIVGPFGIL